MSHPRLLDRYEKLLSPRERQVVTNRLSAFPLKQVAANLGISINTAKHHQTRAFKKLGILCSLELVPMVR